MDGKTFVTRNTKKKTGNKTKLKRIRLVNFIHKQRHKTSGSVSVLIQGVLIDNILQLIAPRYFFITNYKKKSLGNNPEKVESFEK